MISENLAAAARAILNGTGYTDRERAFAKLVLSERGPRGGDSDSTGNGGKGGLQGAELAELHTQMGIRPPITQQFERTPEGGLRIHALGPRVARERAKAEDLRIGAPKRFGR